MEKTLDGATNWLLENTKAEKFDSDLKVKLSGDDLMDLTEILVNNIKGRIDLVKKVMAYKRRILNATDIKELVDHMDELPDIEFTQL